MSIYPCYSEYGRNPVLHKEFEFQFIGEPLVNDIISVSDSVNAENPKWRIVRRQWKINGRLILIIAPPSGVVLA